MTKPETLPRHLTQQINQSHHVKVVKFEDACVLFMNVVDVNGMFSKLSPFKVADLLKEFIQSIEHLQAQFLVHKARRLVKWLEIDFVLF